MLPFGLFDLLKTLLPAPDQSSQSTPAVDNGTETDAPPAPAPASSPAAQSATLPMEEKSNACADFLYRHEQRAQGVKNTKKRLD
ncbi:MAG: hypothetical protein IJ308_02930 [Clostridia bacterium]|nr:hypothetical protein [Clostridia bacterium]